MLRLTVGWFWFDRCWSRDSPHHSVYSVNTPTHPRSSELQITFFPQTSFHVPAPAVPSDDVTASNRAGRTDSPFLQSSSVRWTSSISDRTWNRVRPTTADTGVHERKSRHRDKTAREQRGPDYAPPPTCRSDGRSRTQQVRQPTSEQERDVKRQTDVVQTFFKTIITIAITCFTSNTRCVRRFYSQLKNFVTRNELSWLDVCGVLERSPLGLRWSVTGVWLLFLPANILFHFQICLFVSTSCDVLDLP